LEERLEEVKELYALAKNQIKQLEAMGEGISIPAINELRYVGEHILHASTADNENEKSLQLDKAEARCWRAISDGAELGSIFALEKLKGYQEEYKGLSVTEYIPEYTEILDLAVRLQSLLVKSDAIDPQKYYIEVNKYLPLLMEKLSIVEKTREILHKELKSKQQTTKGWLLGIFFSIGLSMGSGFLYQSLLSEKPTEKTIQSEIENLAKVQESLVNLQGYVSTQQGKLENLNNDISSLTNKREELQKVVNLNQDAVHSLLQSYESKQSVFSMLEVGISFLIGILSSFFVVVLVGFLKRKKLIENT